MRLHIKILIVLALCIGSWFAGKQFGPSKVVIQEKIVTVEKKQERRNVEKVIIKRPDGTTETKIVDRTIVDSAKDTAKSSERTEIRRSQPDWLVSLQSPFTFEPETVGILVQRRILGPIFVGVSGDLDRNFAALITIAF
jgi:hypothetical protein